MDLNSRAPRISEMQGLNELIFVEPNSTLSRISLERLSRKTANSDGLNFGWEPTFQKALFVAA
jgi:hypothetical protein